MFSTIDHRPNSNYLLLLRAWSSCGSSRKQRLRRKASCKGSMKLIVSATSWTPDEDFSILLEALLEYDREATMQSFLEKGGEALPRLLVIVTGNGPLKAYYEPQFSTLELQSVDIKTAWLEPEDYPKLLAYADLGISLHASSSSLDLPMKVVDLFWMWSSGVGEGWD
jgi:beta-1,4-mannosyltransferase